MLTIGIVVAGIEFMGNLLVKLDFFHDIHKGYRFHERITKFNEYFYKEDFVDWILDLEDFFDYMDVFDERKVKLALYKLS